MTVTWLHLSDLHACIPRFGWDAERVTSTLVADLRRLQAERGLRNRCQPRKRSYLGVNSEGIDPLPHAEVAFAALRHETVLSWFERLGSADLEVTGRGTLRQKRHEILFRDLLFMAPRSASTEGGVSLVLLLV